MTISKIHGKARLEIIRLHRLLVFLETFDKYLEGKATAQQVTNRAKKMLEIGLPKCVKL